MRTASCWRIVSKSTEVPAQGCYAVYHDGVLVYVGSSSHLRNRVANYLVQPKRRRRAMVNSGARVWHESTIVTVKVAGSARLGDWLMREYRLIKRLTPRDNRAFTGSHRRRRPEAA